MKAVAPEEGLRGVCWTSSKHGPDVRVERGLADDGSLDECAEPSSGGSTRDGRVDQLRDSGKSFGNSRVKFHHLRVSCEGGSCVLSTEC